jgi:biotin--protein ligase
VRTAPPLASLAQLVPPGRAAPTLEHTAAAILATFGRMWAEFLAARGAFDAFTDLYLERWLHSCVALCGVTMFPLTHGPYRSDQLVTLTTLSPPRAVRIVGITRDHGLLRTLPERDAWSGGGGTEFIDLQPDGNSFDLMAGLIRAKT